MVASDIIGHPQDPDGDQGQVRDVVAALRRKNSDLLRSLSAYSAPASPRTRASEHSSPVSDPSNKAGQRSNAAHDRHQLRVARLQRLHYLMKMRPPMQKYHSQIDIKEPNLPFCLPPPSEERPPVQRVQDIPRPQSLFYSYINQTFIIFCDCDSCGKNPQHQINIDRIWLSGQQPRAASMLPLTCLNLLLPQSSAIRFRAVKPRVPKGVSWVSGAQRATPERDKHKYEIPAPKAFDDESPQWALLEQEIEKTERQIRMLVGSADWTAEVVVLYTSLGIAFNSYSQGVRILRFLEAKGVDHFAIDINSDIGTDSLDYRLVRKWLQHHRIHRDTHKVAQNVRMDALVPQILVDGVPLGSFENLIALEDDGDLDYILCRRACPNCLRDRKESRGSCGFCGASFAVLISREYLSAEEVTRLLHSNEINSSRIKAPTPRDFERRRRELGLARVDEDIASWFTPERMAMFGVPSVGFTVDFE